MRTRAGGASRPKLQCRCREFEQGTIRPAVLKNHLGRVRRNHKEATVQPAAPDRPGKEIKPDVVSPSPARR